MATRGNRIAAVEEKGQMGERSTDVYGIQAGMKEVAICKDCKALYWNKRWYSDASSAPSLSNDMIRNDVLCPACHRVRDHNPAGVVTYSGDYLREHKTEIINTIKHSEEKAHTKNPLARIMDIQEDQNTMVVSTTDGKLAQRLGRDIYKAHSGSLEYRWSKDQNFLRVNWNR